MSHARRGDEAAATRHPIALNPRRATRTGRIPVRAVHFNAFGEQPELADVPEPECPPRGAVIRVRATGLCRSDWHAWMGHDADIALPHVPGHEFAGEIAARRRRGVDSAGAVGDRVTAPFICACGRCDECRSGNQQVCDRPVAAGLHALGLVRRVRRDRRGRRSTSSACPTRSASSTAAALGCRFATAYRARGAQGRLAPGE